MGRLPTGGRSSAETAAVERGAVVYDERGRPKWWLIGGRWSPSYATIPLRERLRRQRPGRHH